MQAIGKTHGSDQAETARSLRLSTTVEKPRDDEPLAVTARSTLAGFELGLLLPGQFRKDKLVRVSDQFPDFALPESIQIYKSDPVVSCHVGRGNDALNFYELAKFFRSALERHLDCGLWVQRNNAVHLSGYAEQQVTLPLNVFCGVRQ